jgi:hypothetical protein
MTGIKSRWFVEIFLDGETVRFWNDFEAITLGGVTFQPLGDRFVPPDKLRRQANLKSETTKLQFDSSRQLDDGDILADLLDAPWRRRQIRIRNVHYSTTPDAGDVISDTYGRIRGLSDSLEAGKDARVEMEIESGSLSYLERRMQTRSAENQKRVFPGDVGFDLTKVLEDVPIIWRTKETKKGSVNPIAPTTDEPEARVLPVGEFMTEGTFVAHFATQQQKKNWIRVFAIADAEIEELNEVWINGEKMISAPLSNGVRTAIPALNSGGTRAWITFHNGAWNQAADSFLDSVETQWTSSHRLRGVAYVVMEHLWDDDNPTSFDYKFGGKGAKFYDRRLDTTAGGSGSHRLVTPSTWAYTKNPMVIADHYRQGIRIMPSTEPLAASYWFGVGEAADVMPYAEYKDLADLCDENVTLKAGGTQKRYEAHGLLSAADDHKKNLEKLASAMAARVIDTSGRIVFRPVRTQTSILTLVDGDMINTASTEYDPTGRIDDMANTIEGRFLDKRNAYKPTDYPPVSNATYIDADGDVISDTRNFDLEVDGERAQRLALLNLAYSRRIATLKETFLSSKVRALKPGDWFTRSSALRGFAAGKLFEVDQLDKSSKGTTTIEAVEVDPDQQAWDETAAATLSTPATVDPITLPALDVPAVTVTAFSYSGGGATVPAVRLAHAAYLDFIGDEIVAEFGVSNGLAGGSLGITGQSGFVKLPGNVAAVETLFGLPPAVAYVIRFRARQGERYSAWSAFQAFTSTGVYEAATSGVASSIIGQDWGATASEASASNALVPTGANAVRDTGFRQPSGYWTRSHTVTPSTIATTTETQAGGLRVIKISVTGGNATGFIRHLADTTNNSLPCRPGDKIAAAALIGGSGLSNAYVSVLFYNASGSYFFESGTSLGVAPAAGTGGEPGFTRHGHFATAPALAAFAKIAARGLTNNATASFSIANPTISIVPADQTALPPFSPGFDAAPGADITEDNTAAAIIGQGSLATLNQATWATQVTGVGKPEDYATLSRVFRQSTAPSSPNVNDIWVQLSGSDPIAVRAWNGTAWITGADITLINTAAGFTGQDWGATASEGDASNAQVPIGANAIGNSEYYAGIDGWIGSQHGGNTAGMSLRAPGTSWAMPTRGTLMVYQADAGTAGYFDVRWRPKNSAGATSYALKVQPGEKVAASVYASAHRCLVQLRIEWRDISGAILAYTGVAENNANSASSTEPDVWPRLTIIGTAPASAAWAEIHIRKNPTLSGTNSYMFLHRPMISRIPSTQTVFPDYLPGTPLDVYGRADPTIDNTAAGFTGQGSLATGNMYYQGTAPASPVNGDFWGDTSTGLLKYRSGGAWVTIASIGGTVITVSRTNSFVKTKIGTGANTTAVCAFSASGGTAPYTWSHQKLLQAPSTPNVSLSSSTAASITATATSGSVGVEVQGSILTTVTDAAGKTAQFVSPLFLAWES